MTNTDQKARRAREMLPCPFCGERRFAMTNPLKFDAEISCCNTDCPIKPSAYGRTLDAAAAKWNTRAAIAAIHPQIPDRFDARECLKGVWLDLGYGEESAEFLAHNNETGTIITLRAITTAHRAGIAVGREAIRMAYKTGYQEGVEDGGGNFCRQAYEEGWQQYSEKLDAPTEENSRG